MSGRSPTPPTPGKSAGVTGKTFAEYVETLAKLAGLAGVVTALIGLPAVHLYFARLGIPSHFIDYQIVLRAGVLPTVLLALFVAFTISIVRKGRKGESLTLLLIFTTPLMIPGLFLLLVGLAAYHTLAVWCMVWLIHWPLNAFHLGATNRELLYLAMVLTFILGATWLLYFYSTSFRRATTRLLADTRLGRWGNRFYERAHREWEPNAGATVDVDSHPPQQSDSLKGTLAPPPSKQQTTEQKIESAREWLRMIPVMWVMIPLAFLVSLYAIKAVAYLWDPTWSSYVSDKLILWSTLCGTVFYCLPMTAMFMDEPMNSEIARVRRLGYLAMAAGLLLSYAILVTFYTAKMYPNLSGVWGGGKLVEVTLWVDRTKVPGPKELTERLPKAMVSEQGSILRLDSVYLVHSTNEIAIIVDDVTDPSGLVLLRSAILSTGWPR